MTTNVPGDGNSSKQVEVATTADPEVTGQVETPQAEPQPAAPHLAAKQPEPLADPKPNQGPEAFQEAMGVGTDGEVNIWEARYSMKNFIGRLLFWGTLAIAWIAFSVWALRYDQGDFDWKWAVILSGIVLGFVWVMLIRRIILARFGHYYRLTNRRIFVSTGVFNRRRDQMELLRINDVYTRQTLFGRWLSVGTVVVVSSEPQLPVVYLAGVDDPKRVMDLIWNQARSERDRRTVKVDQV